MLQLASDFDQFDFLFITPLPYHTIPTLSLQAEAIASPHGMSTHYLTLCPIPIQNVVWDLVIVGCLLLLMRVMHSSNINKSTIEPFTLFAFGV
jgi:hypothetical protein